MPIESVSWMLIDINEIQTFAKISVRKNIILLGQSTSIGTDILLNDGWTGISPAISLAYHLK